MSEYGTGRRRIGVPAGQFKRPSGKKDSSDDGVRRNPRTHLPLTPVDVLDNNGNKVCEIDVDLNSPQTVDRDKHTYKGVFLDKNELEKLLALGPDGPSLVNNAINGAIHLQKGNAIR